MATRREQAAKWLIRLKDPDVSGLDQRRWKAWMKRNARNRQAFSEMEQLVLRMDEYLGDLKDISIAPGQEHFEGRANEARFNTGGVASWLAEAPRRARDRIADWPRWTLRTAMAGAAAVLVGGAYLVGSGIFRPAAVDPVQSYQTAVSEHRSIVLPDGTKISMGAKSSLSVNFSPERRIVILENGEALFDVAKDERRPFVVMVGAGTITALGTVFNVRRDDNRVVVTVTEGSVEVTRIPQLPTSRDRIGDSNSKPTRTTISAGVQAVVGPMELSVVQLDDPGAAIEWQTGHLQYRAEPLKYVVAGVSRYSAKGIIIADRDVGNILFTGSVFQDQTDEWLLALETVFPVEVIYLGENNVLIRKRRTPSAG